MMILGDLHIGVKQDDKWMQNIQRLAIKEAIDISIKNGIKKWIQTGDWFDVRKAITHKTMEFTREIAIMIGEAGIEVDVIVGNHDMSLKQKIHPNACTELLSQFSNFTIYDKISTVEYGDVKIDLCPWICDENKEEIHNHMKTSQALYCVGHFELSGFYFYKGLKSHGDDPSFLCKYKEVWSGHFHTISENRNIKFLGTPYSITSGDENDPRGYWIFDTEKHEMEFIQNSVMWHRRIEYPTSVNIEMYRNLSVRLIVSKFDKNLTEFETALENVVHELKVVNKIDTSVEIDDSETDDVEIKSLSELMDEYIDCIPEIEKTDSDATKIMVKNLYLECVK